MLARENRLLRKNDFKRVFEQGRTTHGPVFVLRALSTNNQLASRCGIIVSKKVAAKAVERNKLKRRLRAQLRKTLPRLHKSADLVIISQAAARQFKSSELATLLEQALRKLKLL